MRGGSSRGGFFLADELPADPRERAALLLVAYGSPDARQIDGIGGADPLTSKAAIVAPATRSDADVDYTFCQVSLDRPRVSTGGNCGNMLAAVGPFAILRGLVPAAAPETIVRIHTTNTGQIVRAHVPIVAGDPAVDGDCEIAGVPSSGARIQLDFGDCAGAVCGRLLPTGSPRDRVRVGDRWLEVSLVDAATPFVFVRARDLGAGGTELPDGIHADAVLCDALESVRGWAAVALGIVQNPEDARAASPNVPRVIMVAPPQPYAALDGRAIAAADADLCVRQMAMQRPHRALAVTGAVCTAVAAALPDTVVAEASARAGAELRLGHPSGVLRVSAILRTNAGGAVQVQSVRVERTARLLMAGMLFVAESRVREMLGRLET